MPKSNTPQIYLIWSGDVSKNIAMTFKKFANMIFSPSINVFMSETDITAGELSVATLLQELKSSEFGLAFIYKDNARAPWINFELGALSSSSISHGVYALIIDNDEKCLAGTPVSDSQYKRFNKDGLWSVLSKIISECELDKSSEIFKERFNNSYPEFQRNCNDYIIDFQNKVSSKGFDSESTNDDNYGEILGQLVSVNNILKLNYVDELKTQITELKKVLLSLSSKNIEAMQLSFKAEKYELAYKNYIEKTRELISKLTSNVELGKAMENGQIISYLEKTIEQIMNICME